MRIEAYKARITLNEKRLVDENLQGVLMTERTFILEFP